MKNLLLIIVLMASLFNGCASINSLPQSASEVELTGSRGRTGWSKYEEVFFLKVWISVPLIWQRKQG